MSQNTTFRTEIKPLVAPASILPSSQIMMLGSCFAEEMGRHFTAAGFTSTINPFGIIFHPIPLAQNIQRTILNTPIDKSELFQHQERWNHWNWHSKWSHTSIEAALRQMNHQQKLAHQALKQATHLFLTFGTAWGYKHVESDTYVANNHRVDLNQFQKKCSEISELTEIWTQTIDQLHTFNPSLSITITVSPVRHLRDGFVENQRSKARLIILAEKLIAHQFVRYFPAYEIVHDDLRDYRFVKQDLVHPNEVAVHYIWQQVQATYMNEDILANVREAEAISRDMNHRAIRPCSSAHASFLEQIEQRKIQLKKRWPEVNFSFDPTIGSNLAVL